MRLPPFSLRARRSSGMSLGDGILLGLCAFAALLVDQPSSAWPATRSSAAPSPPISHFGIGFTRTHAALGCRTSTSSAPRRADLRDARRARPSALVLAVPIGVAIGVFPGQHDGRHSAVRSHPRTPRRAAGRGPERDPHRLLGDPRAVAVRCTSTSSRSCNHERSASSRCSGPHRQPARACSPRA